MRTIRSPSEDRSLFMTFGCPNVSKGGPPSPQCGPSAFQDLRMSERLERRTIRSPSADRLPFKTFGCLNIFKGGWSAFGGADGPLAFEVCGLVFESYCAPLFHFLNILFNL